MEEEKKKMDLLDRGKEIKQKTPDEMKVKNPDFNSQPYKKGGLVIGKKDRNIISFTKTFPFVAKRKVEDIYFVEDDMHSLTIGSTRSGKTRCEVLETIGNTMLSGENMIISDPKRRALRVYIWFFKRIRI